jgi:MerR family transcriptional regulator, light-induced transcriptional regulator
MYTIKKVSEMVGIPTVTIRAWENRYHIITPKRSDGGHRLYNQEDISTLTWLKNQIEKNDLKISEAIHLFHRQFPNGLHAKQEETKSEPERSFIQTYEDLNNKLYTALTDFNTIKANQLIDLAFSLYHFEDVFHKLLSPVLYRIGEEWESGKITVAQEHFSSELIMQRFTQFFRALPTNKQLPKVLAFCPEGENHHIGLMLFSLFLRNKGIEVIYLGANTPYEGLSELIKIKNIASVAISITNYQLIDKVKNWIHECKQENSNVSFIIGGRGANNIRFHPSARIFIAEEIDWEDWFHTSLLNND